jgi:hypothetical protein
MTSDPSKSTIESTKRDWASPSPATKLTSKGRPLTCTGKFLVSAVLVGGFNPSEKYESQLG